MKASEFFSPEGRQLIEQAIADAELDTSGEIRVHVEMEFEGDILDRAASVFARLGMHRTKQRNGVLIFFAVRNRSFAILGDIGVNQVVPDNFWDETKAVMESHFRNSEFALGLAVGIKMAGDMLKKHFPHLQNDTNELVNEISFDSSEA